MQTLCYGFFLVAVGLLSLSWIFYGKRGYKVISRIQGAVIGTLFGWIGGYTIEKIATGSKITEKVVWESLSSGPTLGTCVGVGVLTIILTLLGPLFGRFMFFLMGGILVYLISNAMKSIFSFPINELKVLLIIISIALGAFFVWGSYRKTVILCGVWGGVLLYLASIIFILHLFSWFGGPVWLPFVSGAVISIAFIISGIAVQQDYKEEVIKPMIER